MYDSGELEAVTRQLFGCSSTNINKKEQYFKYITRDAEEQFEKTANRFTKKQELIIIDVTNPKKYGGCSILKQYKRENPKFHGYTTFFNENISPFVKCNFGIFY